MYINSTVGERCRSSAKRFGGNPEDYRLIHEVILAVAKDSDPNSLLARSLAYNTKFMREVLPLLLDKDGLWDPNGQMGIRNHDNGTVLVSSVGCHLLMEIYGKAPTKKSWGDVVGKVDFAPWMDGKENGFPPHSEEWSGERLPTEVKKPFTPIRIRRMVDHLVHA